MKEVSQEKQNSSTGDGNKIILCKHPTCNKEEGCRKLKEKKVRKPIKKRSDKMTGLMKAYRKKKADFFTEHQICEVDGCMRPSEDVHHTRGRVGDDLLDERYWMAVCRRCHEYIETHPDWAKENGYSSSRLNKRA